MSEIDKKKLDIVTSKGRADKAINTLKGILLGINADGIVNQKEVNELVQWSKTHKEQVNRNPFKEFMAYIENISNNTIPTTEIIEDLFWLCQKYEHDNIYYNGVTTDLQTLQGICHGILSDGEITEKEVNDLDKWLNENSHLNSYYPYDEIRSLVLSIVADGKIEEEEILVLKAYLNQFVDIKNTEISNKINKDVEDVHISAHCTSEPDISFDGKVFCITGALKSANRSDIEKRIENLGGITKNNVTKNLDYLIVGDNGNSAWAFACYGRKVEKALEMRKKGHEILLIHEYDLIDAIEDLE